MTERNDEILVKNSRRAPRYGRFIGVGVVLAAIVAVIIFFVGPEPNAYQGKDVLIVLMMYALPVGALLGTIVALIVDRRSLKDAE